MKKYLIIIALVALVGMGTPALAQENTAGAEAGATSTVVIDDNSVHKSRGNIIHPGQHVSLPHAEAIRPMPKGNDDFMVVPDVYLKRHWTMEEIACVTGWKWSKPKVRNAYWAHLEKNDKPIRLLKKQPKLSPDGVKLLGETWVVGASDSPMSEALLYGLREAKEHANAVAVLAEFKGRFKGTNRVLALGTVGSASFAVGGSSMPDKQILGVGGGMGIGKSSAMLEDVWIVRVRAFNME